MLLPTLASGSTRIVTLPSELETTSSFKGPMCAGTPKVCCQFPVVDSCFQHAHVKSVDGFPQSKGCIGFLTCLSRFTKRPEVVHVSDTAVETAPQTFLMHHVATFVCSGLVANARGSHFEVVLRNFLQHLGLRWTHTTPYHPTSKVMIVRLRRRLKAPTLDHSNPD